MTRYLAVRTDKQRRDFILRELRAGRLRQGWGWKPEQDLRLLRQKLSQKQPLSKDEESAWRNRRLLDTEPDGLQPGDVVVLPNLPQQGRWLLARVNGSYRFEFPPEQEGVGRDYAHVVPVTLVCQPDGQPGVVEADNEHVHGGLRGSMRSLSRSWSVDHWKDSIETLQSLITAGRPPVTSSPPERRVQTFVREMREAAWRSIRARFHGAEFEVLIVRLFERLYPEATVEHIGGAGEHGADLLVTTHDVLGFASRIAVQVKMFQGTHDDVGALDQLREARLHHQATAGVVVSTAESLSDRFEKARAQLDAEMPVRVLYGLELTSLLLAHLAGTAALENPSP